MPCTEDVRNWCAYMQQFAHYSLSNEAWRSDCLRSHFILLNTINISCSPRKKKPIPILTVFFLFRSHLVSSRKKRTDDCRNRMCNHTCNLFFFFLNIHRFLSAIPLFLFTIMNIQFRNKHFLHMSVHDSCCNFPRCALWLVTSLNCLYIIFNTIKRY